MSFSTQDKAHMQTALNLARRGLGNVWPNPSVGCVLVNDSGNIVGRGNTNIGGRPHAEAEALSQAGDAARGTTAYVTLEPCSHHGKTPPCAVALIEAGIKRVIIATTDPDPRVSGKGISMLKEKGVCVEEGLCKSEADQINAGFFSRITQNRPYVSLKVATTLDGYIASATGKSKWITGSAARHKGHLLRSQNDAILVGSGTAFSDDPLLDCRIEGATARDQPVRVVLDSKKRLSRDSRLFKSATGDTPVWILNHQETRSDDDTVGLEFVKVSVNETGLIVKDILKVLADRGITRLLIEGGGKVASSFLKYNLVDEIHWFRAPSIMGGDGLPSISSLSISELVDMPRFYQSEMNLLDQDVESVFLRR